MWKMPMMLADVLVLLWRRGRREGPGVRVGVSMWKVPRVLMLTTYRLVPLLLPMDPVTQADVLVLPLALC
jgi:hypothetical protein